MNETVRPMSSTFENGTGTEQTDVFVYGSLLSGLQNHDYLGDAELLGTATLAPGVYAMLDLGSFPGLVDDPDGPRIQGEVYRVDALTLRRLDRLEGHPAFYRRRLVGVEAGPVRAAWVYVLEGRRPNGPEPVASGDWRTYLTARVEGEEVPF